MGILQFGRGHVPDPAHGLEWGFIEERWFPINHLNNHDAQGPDVHLRTIGQPGNDLWCHPIRGAHQGLALGQLLRHLRAEPKVRQFHLVEVVEVISFDMIYILHL